MRPNIGPAAARPAGPVATALYNYFKSMMWCTFQLDLSWICSRLFSVLSVWLWLELLRLVLIVKVSVSVNRVRVMIGMENSACHVYLSVPDIIKWRISTDLHSSQSARQLPFESTSRKQFIVKLIYRAELQPATSRPRGRVQDMERWTCAGGLRRQDIVSQRR